MNSVTVYPVIIVGGGIAGLSCGYTLSQFGIQSLLLEKRPYLGGRASTQLSNPPMDNSPHLISSAYQTLLSLLAEIGSPIVFPETTTVEWYDRYNQKKSIVFRNSRISLIFSLFRNFRLTTIFSFLELFRLANSQCRFTSVEEWMQSKKFPIEFRDFIQLLTLSVMNVEPRDADLTLFQFIVREALFQKQNQFFRVTPIYERIIQPLSNAFTRNGGIIALKTEVTEVIPSENFWLVQTKDAQYYAKNVVLALPAYLRSKLINEPKTDYSPILTVRLLYQDLPHTWWGETTGDFDWFFVQPSSLQLVECIKSGAFSIVKQPNEMLIASAVQTIQNRFPNGKFVKSLGVVRELYATPIQNREWHRNRRSYQTDQNGLWFAADDVQTGLPATMESAAFAGSMVGKLISKKFQSL